MTELTAEESLEVNILFALNKCMSERLEENEKLDKVTFRYLEPIVRREISIMQNLLFLHLRSIHMMFF